MALESFGTEVAKMVNHAAILCHDMIRDSGRSLTEKEFSAGQEGVWKVEPGVLDGQPCVVIKLGVG